MLYVLYWVHEKVSVWNFSEEKQWDSLSAVQTMNILATLKAIFAV